MAGYTIWNGNIWFNSFDYIEYYKYFYSSGINYSSVYYVCICFDITNAKYFIC